MRKRILIVDDDAAARHALFRMLDDRYEVLLATNGQEGLLSAQRHFPDLIVTDVNMPVLDGFSMVRRIRRQSIGRSRSSSSRRAIGRSTA